MQTSKNHNYGNSFVENVGGSTKNFDFLFFCLFAAIFCVILLGNIIFWDSDILMTTLRVGAVCLSFVSILYCLFRIFKNLGWGVVCLYGLVLGLVYCRSPFANIVFYLLACWSCVYTFISIKIKKSDFWYGLAAGVITAVTALGVKVTSLTLTSFNMLDRLAMGKVDIDTLFHCSIAAMIKNYGIASTGLHGLVELHYHVFSHWIMAGISTLSGVGVLEVYGIAQSVFFIPILLFSIVALCLILNPNNNISTVLLWSLVCFFLTVIPAPDLGKKFGLSIGFFVSESLTISLSLLVIGFGLLYKDTLSYGDMALICFLGIFITAAKGSSGLIYMGLWWIRSIFFVKKNHLKTIFATILLSILVTMTVFSSAVTSASILSFWPFYFIGLFSYWGEYVLMSKNFYTVYNAVNTNFLIHAVFSVLLFIVMHFLVSWIAVWQSMHAKGFKFLWRSPAALYSLGSIVAGLLVASFLQDYIVYYFTVVALFVSLPTFLLLCHARLVEYRREHISFEKKFWAIVAAEFALIFILNYSTMSNMFEYRSMKKEPSEFVETLVSIQKHSAADQCFVSSEAFAALNPIENIVAKPFVYPAVSEHPWINVVPENKTKSTYKWYGYEEYGLSSQQQAITMDPVLTMKNGRTLQCIPLMESHSKSE